DDPLKLADHGPAKRLEIDTALILFLIRDRRDLRTQVWIELCELLHARSGDSHDDDEKIAFGRLHHAMNHADRTYFVQIGGSGCIDFLIALCEHDEHPVALLNVVDDFD